MQLKAACEEMDSPFIRRQEENDYQKRLEVLLAVVRRRPELPSVVAFDWLALLQDLSQVYVMSNQPY